MRAYFLGNMYLSSIQQGIQAAHVVHEMFTKYEMDCLYEPDKSAVPLLWEWARSHKTMVLLNGGYQSDLREFLEFLDCGENVYPHASFCEEEASINGALTSVGIVLPERVYGAIVEVREGKVSNTEESPLFWALSSWEQALVGQLSKFGLAR